MPNKENPHRLEFRYGFLGFQVVKDYTDPYEQVFNRFDFTKCKDVNTSTFPKIEDACGRSSPHPTIVANSATCVVRRGSGAVWHRTYERGLARGLKT